MLSRRSFLFGLAVAYGPGVAILINRAQQARLSTDKTGHSFPA